MGIHLDRARAHFGRDTTGMLEGGRYSLVHTRSLEFDDLRPYVSGDDVRDIEWKASARSGNVLIKRFVSEKHHKILVVADAGRNMSATTPTGELKRDVAANLAGAMGLITVRRSDEIGMVFGDRRGSVDIRLRRGETHIEYMLHRFQEHATTGPSMSHVGTQLDWVARHYRHPLVIFVVSDEPDVDDRLHDVLTRLTGRHDVMWAMVSDAPAAGSIEDDRNGFDVGDGGFVLSDDLGADVIDAYRRAEVERRQHLSEFMTAHGVPHAMVRGSLAIRNAMLSMTGTYARAG
ncbi:DUF58 domain-containing protein [Mycolicibacterium hodleri]|uniref:DUF58 domain-containing protein n=1 Tax=Mycolicibacterium hodleri TaxID=49897 RepID=A0A502DM32_9MYCO|nr:DUF58 domain-containing protein [Mycolicibacterium hodleri]TPG25539.1 DUF58 domain-containing protein [Mycolicibacterium hodleri]